MLLRLGSGCRRIFVSRSRSASYPRRFLDCRGIRDVLILRQDPSYLSLVLRTMRVCAPRNFLSLALSSGREFASIDTANNPAFLAPLSPIASVPPGTRAGI